jgi:hypothetical protein
MHQGNSSLCDYDLFAAIKQNVGCYRLRDIRGVKKFMTRWLVAKDTHFDPAWKNFVP